MSALVPVVRGGVVRRRLQTFVVGIVVTLSTATVVLAAGLLAASNSPFDHAFARADGAQVVATIAAPSGSAPADPGTASDARIRATARVAGVAAAAGPFARTTAGLRTSDGQSLPPLVVVGRADAGGSVDRITLDSGRWARAPGEIVLSRDAGGGPDRTVGTRLETTGSGPATSLLVVGIADSVSRSADAWVTPAQLPALRPPGAAPETQMLYRFAAAHTDAEISRDTAALRASLPAHALLGTASYLAVKRDAASSIGPFVPFLVAFGVLGLIVSVLVVGNVISGAVLAGFRDIGVLKSVGFTPAQVGGVYVAQALVPAVVGTVAGAALGNLLAVPLLTQTARAYDLPAVAGVDGWIDVLALAGIPALVAVAAALPARRAARMSAAAAISAGRAPRVGRGYRVQRLLARAPIPRAVGLGLAAPAARPARTAATLVAIMLGVATVSFAVGLNSSLDRVVVALGHGSAAAVEVDRPTSGAGPAGPSGPVKVSPGGALQPDAALSDSQVTALLRAQPGTARFVSEARTDAHAAGLTLTTDVTFFRGSSSWLGYTMIHGRWFRDGTEVVVPTGFLRATGTKIGDSVVLDDAGRQARFRIVGEVFDTDNRGLRAFTAWSASAMLAPGLQPDEYQIGLTAGTSGQHYSNSLGTALGTGAFLSTPSTGGDRTFAIVKGLILTLTLMLAVVAGLGVFNTVLLNTRERGRDIGILKSLGMTPRQVTAMVVTSMVGIGLVAGLVGVPVGGGVHHLVLPAMARAAGTGLPAVFLRVYPVGVVVLVAGSGLGLAVLGAIVPAQWAARIRAAAALRGE